MVYLNNLCIVFSLTLIFHVSVNGESQLWGDQMIDGKSEIENLLDYPGRGSQVEKSEFSHEADQSDDFIDKPKSEYSDVPYDQLSGKRNFEGIPMLDESEIPNEEMEPRERRFGKTSFFAGRGKRQDAGHMYDLIDVIPSKERRLSPRTFIGARGKRMSPLTLPYSPVSPLGPIQRQALLQILRAASNYKSLKSKKDLPEKRRRFTALRGR